MVSPARPSRESITLSSMWAQKGHFTRGYLLWARQLTKLIHISEFARVFGSSYCKRVHSCALSQTGSFQCDSHFFFFFGGHSFQLAQTPAFVNQHGNAQQAAT